MLWVTDIRNAYISATLPNKPTSDNRSMLAKQPASQCMRVESIAIFLKVIIFGIFISIFCATAQHHHVHHHLCARCFSNPSSTYHHLNVDVDLKDITYEYNHFPTATKLTLPPLMMMVRQQQQQQQPVRRTHIFRCRF